MTDAVLVRAPVGVAYRLLTDLDGWPRWLDGCRSVRLGPGPAPGPADRHALVLPGIGRPSRLEVVSHGWRHDEGMRWEVSWSGRGPGAASVEWWLEERREGVVVHHLVHDAAEGAPGGRRRARAVLRYRKGVMLALQALKDHLELAVAHAAGRVP